MPRRRTADPLARAIGKRICFLREEAGLTLEKLAYESELGSKGHLSSIEKGLVRPTAHTLAKLAERLGCLPLDLLCFPEEGDREHLIEATRALDSPALRKLLRSISE